MTDSKRQKLKNLVSIYECVEHIGESVSLEEDIIETLSPGDITNCDDLLEQYNKVEHIDQVSIRDSIVTNVCEYLKDK